MHVHTLLFLHIGEIFKRECPHRRSPESIGLHDRLQAGPDGEGRQRNREKREIYFNISNTEQKQKQHERRKKRDR